MHNIFDRKKTKNLPLTARENKITLADIYQLDDKIPEYENPDLEILAKKIIAAREKNKPVIWMMGAHVIRRGNSRFIIDLMKRGIITHIAANGACAIHDFELAFQGATCEDVEKYIKDGKFGNWEETGRIINEAVNYGFKKGRGFGESIGRMIHLSTFPFRFESIFRNGYLFKIPITVHKSIGQDITDQHPSADYEALGGASGQDFLIFAESISKLEGGGIFLNIGTQVMGPEVYLKALSMARNVAAQEGKEIKNFTTAVFDIIHLGDWKNEPDIVNYKKPEAMSDPRYYFRPLKSILIRTVKDGGGGLYIQGDFRITIPNLYHRIIEVIKKSN